MSKVPKRRIQEIMTTIDCPQDFACYKSGFADLCRQPILEQNNGSIHKNSLCAHMGEHTCKMRVFSQSNYCCKCPLRLYVATYLNNLAALEGDISQISPEETGSED